MPFLRSAKKRKSRTGKSRTGRGRSARRTLRCEALESRNLLTATPFGATPNDTAEYLLGDVLVNVVFMESDGTIDPNARDWSQQQKTDVKNKVMEGVNWWKDTLAAQNSVHELNFQFDFTNADTPIQTGYEPINNTSNTFSSWINDFFGEVGFDQTNSFSDNIRAYNNAQRVANDADWSFTIFVVNSPDTPNDTFAPGGSFSRAFAFAGGRFFIAPSGRPASTFTHELGHMFWARDEYAGGSTYSAKRGYYNAQNLNAANNPAPGFVQQPSVMATGSLLQTAFDTNTNAAATLEMVGWRDSDNNGIFDVLDVPLTLTGSGAYDPLTRLYRFVGSSSVQTLANQNSSGLQSDITINQVSRVQYRIDGGAWIDQSVYNASFADIDITIGPLPAGFQNIEIRTIDDKTNEPGEVGVMSPIFQGGPNDPAISFDQGIRGFVYQDGNGNAQRDASDAPLVGWTVEVLSSAGQPLNTSGNLEPDNYADATNVSSIIPTATLSAGGFNVLGSEVRASAGTVAPVGNKVFGNRTAGGWGVEWSNLFAELTIEFSTPVSRLDLDAIGNSADDFARIEIFDANFQSLGRYTTAALGVSQTETMSFNRANADIKFAIAKGHSNTTVLLDNLRFGAQTIVQTDANGAYWVQGLDAGSYQVQISPPAGWETTTPGGSSQLVVLPDAGAVDAAFGVRPQWQNANNALDVNNDGLVDIKDLLGIVSHLRSSGIGPLPTGQPGPNGPFVDVNADGQANILDLLDVITFLRASAGGSEGEQIFDLDTLFATEDVANTNDVANLRQMTPDSFAPDAASSFLGRALKQKYEGLPRPSVYKAPQHTTSLEGQRTGGVAIQNMSWGRKQFAAYAFSLGRRERRLASDIATADAWEQMLTGIADDVSMRDIAISEEAAFLNSAN